MTRRQVIITASAVVGALILGVIITLIATSGGDSENISTSGTRPTQPPVTTTLPPAIGGGDVKSAVELAEKLAGSPQFTNCIARTVLQYALVDFTAPVEVPLAGKTAGCAVIDMVDKYKAGNGKSFTDLVRATTSTPAFAIRAKTQ